MSVEETRDALKALRDDGVAVDRIVANRLTQPPPQRCAWCSARRRVEQQALSRLEQDRLAGRARSLSSLRWTSSRVACRRSRG